MPSAVIILFPPRDRRDWIRDEVDRALQAAIANPEFGFFGAGAGLSAQDLVCWFWGDGADETEVLRAKALSRDVPSEPVLRRAIETTRERLDEALGELWFAAYRGSLRRERPWRQRRGGRARVI